MQVFQQIIFRAREREDEPAVATASGVVSYRTLARSVETAVTRLGPLERAGALAVIDVADPLHHLCLVLALGLLGVPSASLIGGGPLPDIGPAPTLLLSDRPRPEAASLTLREVDAGWFAGDPHAAPDYARLLGLPTLEPDAIVRLLYSSGTTGRRKCVAYTMAGLTSLLIGSSHVISGRNALRGAGMSLMDLSIVSGNSMAFATLCRGGLLCLPASPAHAIDLIRLFQVEYLTASIGQMQGLLDLLRGRQPLHSLKNVMLMGARLPLRSLAEARARLCHEINFIYGSTELGIVAVGSGSAIERQEGSVGYVVPGVAVEIVDAAGKPLPPGEEGAVRIRTPNQMYYVGTFGERLETLTDGWFYPGDRARLAADGQLLIVGRNGDVLNKGGVIVAPEVIEEAYAKDPGVKDLAAVGVRNARGLEEVWLAVVVDDGVDLKALAARGAALLRERAADRLVRVASIPRTENRKVQRARLRDDLQALATPPRAS